MGVVSPQVGHAGTLDPEATGLLIICVGKGCKKVVTAQLLVAACCFHLPLPAMVPCHPLCCRLGRRDTHTHSQGCCVTGPDFSAGGHVCGDGEGVHGDAAAWGGDAVL
jgi:TruB family pseudouridylate synthase (N terminal domain)